MCGIDLVEFQVDKQNHGNMFLHSRSEPIVIRRDARMNEHAYAPICLSVTGLFSIRLKLLLLYIW